MTIEQAIFQADELKPNQIPRAEKISWLSHLDKRIFREIIQQHDPDPAYPDAFSGYTQDTPPDTELLAKAPYDELYLYCLQMRADLVNQEYDKYNNDLLLFSAAWGAFARAYHREHRFRLTPPWLRF